MWKLLFKECRVECSFGQEARGDGLLLTAKELHKVSQNLRYHFGGSP